MPRLHCILPDSFPQIGTVDIDVQTETIYSVIYYIVRKSFNPPFIQVGMSTLPVKIGHSPRPAFKPVRMLFNQWRITHDSMRYNIKKYTDTVFMGLRY